MAKRPSPQVVGSGKDTRPCVVGNERIHLSPMPVWSRTYATGGCYINSIAVPTHNAIAAHTHDAYTAILDCLGTLHWQQSCRLRAVRDTPL